MDAQELGRQVMRRRKDLRLSQEGLAQRASLSRNWISLIERGEAQNVSMNVVSQLAAALGTTSAVLLGQTQSDATLVPPALRALGLEDHLSYATIEWLARMPRRGPEPKTTEEWRKLYEAVREFLDE